MLLPLLIAIFAWILGLFMPWWSLVIPCLLFGAWLGKSGKSAFGYGFLGVGILWLIQTVFIHFANNGILTTRIAHLFSLPSPLFVILATVIIGGLAGGFSSLSGYLFVRLVHNPERRLKRA